MNLQHQLEQAVASLRAGDYDSASESAGHVARLAPGHPAAWQIIGMAAFAQGRFAVAEGAFRRALNCEPQNPAHAINLANALIKLDRDDEASSLLSVASARASDSADLQIALGILARRAGRVAEALTRADRALEIDPRAYPALVNRGRALHEMGRFEAAIAAYDRAIEVAPSEPPAHAAKALSMLVLGRYAEGWAEYEWRGEGTDLAWRRRFAQPEWTGEDPAGMTILVQAEQGYGDSVQFCRFLPRLAAAGARIIFEAPPALAPLVKSLGHGVEIAVRGTPLPPFDRHIRLMSLPLRLEAFRDADFTAAPYLSPPPRRFLPPDVSRPTIALAWAGNPTHENDRNRSLTPQDLAPLAEVDGIRFVSVQKGPGPKAPILPVDALDLGGVIQDFGDLAAVLAQCDLLLSVDSAPAHVMGALGRPVWIMVTAPSDWRWGAAGVSSSWYSSARLFRQPEIGGGWGRVVENVVAAIRSSRW